MISRQVIQSVVQDIAREFDPQRIVLFGSYARGEATENSDLDLLVVSNTDAPRGKRSAPILSMLARKYQLPIDVVIQSEQALSHGQNRHSSLASQVSKEGITLYEKPKP